MQRPYSLIIFLGIAEGRDEYKWEWHPSHLKISATGKIYIPQKY